MKEGLRRACSSFLGAALLLGPCAAPCGATAYRAAVDLRGHGESSKPECCYTRYDFAYDIKLLLDTLHMGHADVVGHSWGSIVAQTFAELWPQRTARVVLIASTAGPPPNRPGKTAVRLDGNHIDAPPAGGPRTERPPKRCGGEDSGW